MLGDDTPRDVQPESHACETSVVDVFPPMEALEDQRLILERDADALVGDAQMRLFISLPDTHLHGCVIGTVLECVLDEVGNHLIEARRVDGYDYPAVDVQLYT